MPQLQRQNHGRGEDEGKEAVSSQSEDTVSVSRQMSQLHQPPHQPKTINLTLYLRGPSVRGYGNQTTICIWCFSCKENGRIHVDLAPRWRFSTRPLYLERRLDCLDCRKLNRFITIQNLPSISRANLKLFREKFEPLGRAAHEIMRSNRRPSLREPGGALIRVQRVSGSVEDDDKASDENFL